MIKLNAMAVFSENSIHNPNHLENARTYPKAHTHTLPFSLFSISSRHISLSQR